MRIAHRVFYYAIHIGFLSLAAALLILFAVIVQRIVRPDAPLCADYLINILRTLLLLAQIGVYGGMAFSVIDGGYTINTCLDQWINIFSGKIM